VTRCGSSWRDSDGNLNSPELWQNDGKRKLNLNWRNPENQLNANDRCVALPQASAWMRSVLSGAFFVHVFSPSAQHFSYFMDWIGNAGKRFMIH